MSNTDTAAADAGSPAWKRKSLIKPLVIMLIVVAVLMGGIFGYHLFMGKMMAKYMAAGGSAPQTVSTVTAARATWQARMQATGSVRAVRGADLAAQVAGVVDTIDFESGADVPAGAPLLRLKLNDDTAKLQQFEAAAELAAQTFKRDQEQFAAQAISQSALDTDAAALKAARAEVAAQQALIDEKIIKAPFAGRLGIRLVDVGQYLSAGTAIVTLQAEDPVLIDFYLPQQAIAHLKTGQAAAAVVDAYPGARFTGSITSINSKVDTASRNVLVRASFRNPDRRLVPGMYATVEIDSGDAQTQVTLPQTAITYNPYGDTVFIVDASAADADGKTHSVVHQRFVKLGATRGDQVAVLSGVAVGDVIVTAGQMKLRNDAPIVIDNSVKPTDDQHPTPPNE